jgi:hypothetical protein
MSAFGAEGTSGAVVPMSLYDPKRTYRSATIAAARGSKADNGLAASDPKRTSTPSMVCGHNCWNQCPNSVLAPLARLVQHDSMSEGRLIRVSKYRGDPQGIAYIVVVPDEARAIELIRDKLKSSGDEIEDLGRVSDALIKAMSLVPGEILPIAGVSHIAQQQQQPQVTAEEKK